MIYKVRIEYGAVTGVVTIIDDDQISAEITFPYRGTTKVIHNGKLRYGHTPAMVIEGLVDHPELPEDLKNKIKIIYTAFKMEEKCTNIEDANT